MNTYAVSFVKYPFGEMSAGGAPEGGDAQIAEYPWGGDYRPTAWARVEWDDFGLRVAMAAREEKIAANETKFGGRVCEDSCLEFFVNPCPISGDIYMNFEINPSGVMHIGAGAARENRRVLEAPAEGMEITTRREGDIWAAKYRVPFSLLIKLCGGVEREMRANFYKCDESIHPHFGVWNAVSAPKPDFHRPECFGKLLID